MRVEHYLEKENQKSTYLDFEAVRAVPKGP